MKRLLLVFIAVSVCAGGPECGGELVNRWNRFATDANAYIAGLNQGIVDARVRGRLDREWKAITACECW